MFPTLYPEGECIMSKSVKESLQAIPAITISWNTGSSRISGSCDAAGPNRLSVVKEKCSINERDLGFISSFSDICTKKDVCLDDIKNAIIDVCKSREIKL